MSRPLKSVLVPLDGSAFAEHALALAAAIARHAGAKLHLVHVLPDLADQHFWAPMPGSQLERDLHQDTQQAARNYLEGVRRRLSKTGDVPLVIDVVEEKEGITESIRANALDVSADLVVMSYHGRGPLARFWLGSVADSLVRSLSVPILLVPADESVADLDHKTTLHHVLVPLDGTVVAESALEPALAISKAMGADLTLIRVIPQSDDQLRRSAADYLQTVEERLRADGAQVQTRVVVAEQPATAILEESRSSADLVAVETRGRSTLSRILRGSVAHQVVHGSELPVLVCRLPVR